MDANYGHVLEAIADMLRACEPITFVDVAHLVDTLPKSTEASQGVLAALAALDACEHLTDGGREVLAQFMQPRLNQLREQRLLSTRTLTLFDHGALGRATIGARIKIQLPQAKRRGLCWSVVSCTGDGACHQVQPNLGANAVFELHIMGPKTVTLCLEQRSEDVGASAQPMRNQRFVVTFLVDEP